MKLEKKYNLSIYICLLVFFLSSIFSIYNSSTILSNSYSNLYIKQIIWYATGIIVFLIVLFIGNEKIIRHSLEIYIVSIILLVAVLFFGTEINNTRGWFTINGINFQPSEFAKIGLILFLSKIINNYYFVENKTWKKELKLLIKIFIVTLIPSVLVFIEPDTGSVVSYFLIMIVMILVSKLRKRWIVALFLTGIIIIFLLSFFYVKYPNSFMEFFGNNFYYRIFRIVDWKNSSGMQLENSLITIASSGLFGKGLNNIPLYFPASYTDFIFTVFTNTFGLIGAIILIITIILFDIKILKFGNKSTNTINKYIISGIIVCFIFPQLQNISMTVGISPIMGIALPFISYGGSVLITSFILLGLAINSKNYAK